MRLSLLSLIFVTLCSLAQAAEEDKNKADFSAAGRKRVLTNFATINDNIKIAESNVRLSEQNIKTIEEEFKTLDAYQTEHLELKKKYDAYLAMASDLIKKNEKETGYTKLPSMPAIPQGGKKASEGGDAGIPKNQAIAQDKSARAKWRQDADAKVARVNALVRGVQVNLREIDAHRAALKPQLSMWRSRIGEYRSALVALQKRKTEMQPYADAAKGSESDSED